MASLEQIRTTVRFRLGQRSDLTSGDGLVNLDSWINEAQEEICHMFRFHEQEDEITLTTNATDRFIELPASTFSVLTVRDLTNNRPITPLEGDWHEYERRDTTVRGTPTKWLHFKNRLYFYLPPDAALSLRVGVWNEPTPLADIADVPDLPTVWHQGVKILATRNGWRALGDDRRAELIEQGEWQRFLAFVKTPGGAERRNPKRRGLRQRHYITETHKGV